MKKITRLLATVALLFGVVGGVTSVKAERTYGSMSVVYQATWESGTNTMGWKEASSGAWYILNTGLPKGDISAYTTFHATLSNFSDNADFIRLIIKDGTNEDVVRLVEGENTVDLKALSNCDYTKITEVYLWGSDAAKEGETISAESPASVVVTDVYLYKPDAPFVSTVSNGFGDEITSLEDVTDGTRFVIGDGTNAMYWVTSSTDNQKASAKNVPIDAYYYFVLEKVDGLDTDGDGNEETDNYRINIINAAGEVFHHVWNFGHYLNYSMWGHLFAASSTSEGNNTYGWDGNYYGIWKVAYSDGNGFTLKNAGISKYAKVIGSSDDVTYLKFYKSIEFTSTTMYPANDEIFALSKAAGYNAETGEMTNGTWTFETPVDLSKWKYIIIAMEDGCANKSCEIKIIDNDGKTVSGEDYVGTDAGTGPNMWFSRWNHQNIGCLSLAYLKDVKGLDIENIKSLSIAGTTKPFAVYLSCYDNSKLLSTNRWYLYKEGDLIRSYAKADVGNFGTICLPYKASCAGAEVYSIAYYDGSAIALTKVNGLLEAGKPYFYRASDNIGQDNAGENCNVNFFRADFDRYDVATPVENNGLIGTFEAISAPMESLILKNNKLYKVDSNVNVGANKAYVDKTKISDVSTSRVVFLSFDEATGIKTVNNAQKVDGFFNLKGQRVSAPTKGLYIVNGKKVVIK